MAGEILLCVSYLASDFTRTPKVVVDAQGRIVVAMAGRPKKEVSWGKSMDGLEDFLAETKEKMRLVCESCRTKSPDEHCKACSNRRGDFRAVSFGLSFGGGQSVRSPSR